MNEKTQARLTLIDRCDGINTELAEGLAAIQEVVGVFPSTPIKDVSGEPEPDCSLDALEERLVHMGTRATRLTEQILRVRERL